jgi:hypothetical protein
MPSKIATGASMNASQPKASTFVQGPTTELSKEMKNVKEWKSTQGENKM